MQGGENFFIMFFSARTGGYYRLNISPRTILKIDLQKAFD